MSYRIGIDLGGTNIKVGLVNEDNAIVGKKSVPTLVNRPYQEIIADMAACVKDTLKEANVTIEDCETLGIGSPGTIDSETGVVLYSNNFGWKDIALAKELKQYLPIPIRMSNDANCAALGEAVAGAAKGCKNVVLLTLGTGVGSGIVLNGSIFEGGHPGGAELGHSVMHLQGEPCSCGRKGCFEAYASATALIRDTKRAAKEYPDSVINELCGNNPDNINGKTAFDAKEQKDVAGTQVVDNYIAYLSEGIANIINVFRPDRVLLSGGVCNQKEALTEPINQRLKELCFGGENSYIAPVMTAMLGNDAGIIGAANL